MYNPFDTISFLQEDGYMTKFLNYNLRSIYAFHFAPPPPMIEEVSQVTTQSSQVRIVLFKASLIRSFPNFYVLIHKLSRNSLNICSCTLIPHCNAFTVF